MRVGGNTMTCAAASALAAATFVGMMPGGSQEVDRLVSMLDDGQRRVLDAAVEERSKIAFNGLLLGLLLAAPLAVRGWNPCASTFLLFATQSVYYNLSAKQYWVLDHLTTREQVKQWLLVYQTFKYNGAVCAICAAAAYLSLSLLRCSGKGPRDAV